MYNVAIIVPVYYHEDEVRDCLIRLMRCNYDGINPTLYIPVTGMRDSFKKTFFNDYINHYNKRTELDDVAVFDNIISIHDESIFDPTDMMNEIIGAYGDSFDYIAVVEPLISFESLNWLQDLLTIHIEYIHKRKLGAICTNNKSHTLKKSHNIKWYVGDWSIIRSYDGSGFGNGVMLTTPYELKLVGGFTHKEYTNAFAVSCYRKNYIVVYAEDVR